MSGIRKYLSVLLCVCLSNYAMPVFASVSAHSSEQIRVVLGDAELAAAVGGSGSVDATLADYTVPGSTAKVVFANRTTLGLNYELNVTDANGNILETMASGTLVSDSALLVSGTPTVPDAYKIQARIWSSGVPGLEAKDSSWASEY